MDELSRGINPFTYLPSYGLAEGLAPAAEIALLFRKFGIVKVRAAYSLDDAVELYRLCEAVSGLKPIDIRQVFRGIRPGFVSPGSLPPANTFWGFSANQFVRQWALELLGPHAIEFHASVMVHHSVRRLARAYPELCGPPTGGAPSASTRKPAFGVWHVAAAPGMYGASLSFVPFSHDPAAFETVARRVGFTRGLDWFEHYNAVLVRATEVQDDTEVKEYDRHLVTLSADPGDVLLIHGALLHAGGYLAAPRYLYSTSYAEASDDLVSRLEQQFGPSVAPPVRYHRFLSKMGFAGSDRLLKRLTKSA